MLKAGQAFVLRAPDRAAAVRRPFPGPAALARNAARSAVQVVAGAAKGQPVFVAQEIREKRLGICRACSYYVAEKERCSHPKCGCFMKFKTALNAMRCPAEKW